MKLIISTNQSLHYITANKDKKNMDKFFLVFLFSLLIVVAHGVAGNMLRDNIGLLEELQSLDIEEEDENEVELSGIPSWNSERGGKVLVNVDSFGAAGNGESDDTQVSFNILRNEMNTYSGKYI